MASLGDTEMQRMNGRDDDAEMLVSKYQKVNGTTRFVLNHMKLVVAIAVVALVVLGAVGVASGYGAFMGSYVMITRHETRANTQKIGALQDQVAGAILQQNSNNNNNGNGNSGGGNNNNNNNGGAVQTLIGGTHILQSAASLDFSFVSNVAQPSEGLDLIYSRPDSASGKRRAYAYVPRSGYVNGRCSSLVSQSESGSASLPLTFPLGFDIIDVTDPKRMSYVRFLATPPNSAITSTKFSDAFTTPFFTGQVYAVGLEACFNDTMGGVILYNVDDPANPVPISPIFGNPTPYTTGRVGGCMAGNVYHRAYSVSAFAVGSCFYVGFTDVCNQQVFFLPQEVLFNVTDPANPVLLSLWESRDNSMLDFTVPVMPVPYNGPSSPINALSVQYFVNGNRSDARVFGSANDVGWAVVDVSNPLNMKVVAQSTWPSSGDWLNPDEPSVGNAQCGAISPDGQFAVASHGDNGYSTTLISIIDGAYAGVTALATEESNNQLRLGALPGKQRSGRTVYLGYACNGMSIPPHSSLPTGLNNAGEDWVAVIQRGPVDDPNFSTFSPCTYQEKMDNAIAAGYTWAVVFANHHANSQPPANSPDTIANTGIGSEPYPLTVAVATTHRLLHNVFNITLDITLPYPLMNSSSFSEPLVGAIGSRVSIQGSHFRGVAGYWHLLNATSPNLDELAHYMPEESGFKCRFLRSVQVFKRAPPTAQSFIVQHA